MTSIVSGEGGGKVNKSCLKCSSIFLITLSHGVNGEIS